jgi:hypothetical protein
MKITFIPSTELAETVTESPVPAKSVVPNWYKKSPVFDSKNPVFNKERVIVNTELKMCMPFFDAMTGGYIQKTWADIFIGSKDNRLFYEAAAEPPLISHRHKVNIEINENNYYPVEYFWYSHWRVKLPKGYSLLITHPHNRLDLPFTTLTGFTDSDSYYHTPVGAIPFFVHRGFQGIIPAGTPMYQMIPVKRDSWEREVEKFEEDVIFKRAYLMRSRFYGAYRDMFWNKKQYN